MRSFELNKTDQKLAILIDPDKHSEDELFDFVAKVNEVDPDFILIGGSLIYKSTVEKAAKIIRAASTKPLVLFPGHFTHLNDEVDAVLLLSLISGRNPELLIGQHVLAAPILKDLRAEIHSTGYMLIEGGNTTSVSYMSNTQPIPRGKNDIAVCTALAGEYIGMKNIYLDAGSGAIEPIASEMVKAVADACSLPLIVGGGIKSLEGIERMWNAGANLVVLGNALEDENGRTMAELSRRKEKTV